MMFQVPNRPAQTAGPIRSEWDLRFVERQALFDRLEQQAAVLRALLQGMPDDEARWRPEPAKWCALEVTCHLLDEEREDFRARIQSTLESPVKPWPKIDPPAWVSERRYMEQDLVKVLAEFLSERARSVAWLRGLNDAPWGNAYQHPSVGPVSCDLLLANWVAHDLHHIRQLNNLRYAFLRAGTRVPLDYAGTW